MGWELQISLAISFASIFWKFATPALIYLDYL